MTFRLSFFPLSDPPIFQFSYHLILRPADFAMLRLQIFNILRFCDPVDFCSQICSFPELFVFSHLQNLVFRRNRFHFLPKPKFGRFRVRAKPVFVTLRNRYSADSVLREPNFVRLPFCFCKKCVSSKPISHFGQTNIWRISYFVGTNFIFLLN